MRHLLYGLLFAYFNLNSCFLNAQSKTGIIEKNKNLAARGLIHDLNESGDTLLIRSTKKIEHIYSINSKNKREIDWPVNANEIDIPLQSLSAGKHVFAVSYLQRKIVFVVRIHDPNSTYLNSSRRTEVVTTNN